MHNPNLVTCSDAEFDAYVQASAERREERRIEGIAFRVVVVAAVSSIVFGVAAVLTVLVVVVYKLSS